MSPPAARSLTAKTSLNAATAVFNALANIIVGLVVSPALLSILGPVQFGTWKFCQRLLSFVAGAENQSTQGLKWRIANSQADPDTGAKRRDVGSALVVSLGMVPIVVILGGSLAWLAPTFINDLDPELFSVTRITCAVLVLGLVLTPLQQIPAAVLFGMNLSYKIAWLRFVAITGTGALMVGFAMQGWGISGVAVASLIAPLAAAVIVVGIARRTLTWFGVSRPSRLEVRSFFGFSIWILAWEIVGRIVFTSDIIVLGLVSSAATVSTFVLSNYAIQMAGIVSLNLIGAGMPSLGGIVGSGDFARATKMRSEIIRTSWLINTIFGCMILLWNRSFVSLWVGPENFIGTHETLLMVLLAIQFVLIRTDSNILNVTLDVRKKVYLGFVSGSITFGLGYGLGRLYDGSVLAVLVGLLIGRLVMGLVMPALVRQAFGIPKLDASGLVRPLVTTIIALAGTEVIGIDLLARGWVELIGGALISLAIIAPVVFFLGLSRAQRRQALGRLQTVIALARRLRG